MNENPKELEAENERQKDAIKDVLSSSNDSLRLLAVELFIPRPESPEFWGKYNVFVAVRDELEKLKEDNKQLHRQYVGQRAAARVNWDKVKALEAENADLRLSIDDVIDFVSNLYPHLEDELRHRVRLIFTDKDKQEQVK